MKRLLTRLRISSLPCLIMSMLLLAACHDPHTSEILTLADRLMESAPDSAYTLLRSIDSTRLRRADAPLYAVLDAQARHKLDLTPPSDSLLDIAVEHYTTHGPDSLLMKALFYRAGGYKARGNIEKATGDAIFSWDIASEGSSSNWKAKTAEILADLNRETNNSEEEIRWRRLAALEYAAAGKKTNQLFVLCDLAIPLSNQGNPKTTIQFLDSLYPFIKAHNSSSLETYYYEVALPVVAIHGNLDKSRQYLRRLTALYDDSLPLQYEIYRAHIHLRNEDYSQAIQTLSKVRNSLSDFNDTLLYWNESMEVYAGLGQFETAYALADSLMGGQYRLFQSIMAKPDVAVQRNFYQQRYTSKHREAENNRHKILLLSVLFILIVILSIGVNYYMRKRVQRKLKIQMEEVFELRRYMKEQEETNRLLAESLVIKESMHKEDMQNINHAALENEALRQRLNLHIETQALLYRDKWDLLNLLCKEFQEIKGDEREYKRRYNKILKHLDTLRSPGHRKDIEAAVDKYMDNLVSRLRVQCPGLREKEVEFLTLVYAGFTPKTIAFFFHIEGTYIYTLRDRIEKKLENSNAEDKMEFLKYLRRY